MHGDPDLDQRFDRVMQNGQRAWRIAPRRLRKGRLLGNEGDDMLYGQAGDDTFDCGPGPDLADGGPGNDSEAAPGTCEAQVSIP